jgi:hypothetical protein
MLIQGDETVCKNGIMECKFESEDGRPGRSSILIEFNGEHADKFSSISDAIQQLVAESIHANLGKLGAFGKKFMDEDDDVEEKMVISSIKKAITPCMNFRTTEDGKRDTSRPRYRYVQLNDYGVTRTIFYRPSSDGKLIEVPTKPLYRRSLKIIPTFDFKRGYIGATASIQMFLASAILISITSAPTITPVEMAAAKRAIAADPDAIAQLEKSLEEMTTDVPDVTQAATNDAVPEFAKADSPVASTHEEVVETHKENEEENEPAAAGGASEKKPYRRFKRS